MNEFEKSLHELKRAHKANNVAICNERDAAIREINSHIRFLLTTGETGEADAVVATLERMKQMRTTHAHRCLSRAGRKYRGTHAYIIGQMAEHYKEEV